MTSVLVAHPQPNICNCLVRELRECNLFVQVSGCENLEAAQALAALKPPGVCWWRKAW
ncbi:MAG: hypothetical protein HC848_04520 [Limnobacter sp.]|nr:hypothetical protein [Limnobacter sp.]